METTIVNHKSKFLAIAEQTKSSLISALPLVVSEAQTALENLDIPTSRHEEWKYTRTTKLQNERFSIQKSSTASIDYRPFEALRLVFVNGVYNASLSDHEKIDGLSIRFDEEIKEQTLIGFDIASSSNFFEALQRATSTSALHIQAEKGAVIEKPIHIVHLIDAAQTLATPSIFVKVNQNASLEINESFISSDATASGLTIRQLWAQVDKNARLEYNKMQDENDLSYQMCLEDIQLADDAYSNFNTLTLNGGWVRNDLRIALNGKNIESNLSGFYLPRNKQLIDNHTKVDHRYPHCVSNELYKGILFDQSTGVFNGKVYVRKDAQKTNAYQNNANIIAGDQAVMNTKPELEIYANDVKCSHGTTTGQLDESAMWYLRSRGIGVDAARRLLTSAFINDVISKISNQQVAEFVIADLTEKNLLYV